MYIEECLCEAACLFQVFCVHQILVLVCRGESGSVIVGFVFSTPLFLAANFPGLVLTADMLVVPYI